MPALLGGLCQYTTIVGELFQVTHEGEERRKFGRELAVCHGGCISRSYPETQRNMGALGDEPEEGEGCTRVGVPAVSTGVVKGHLVRRSAIPSPRVVTDVTIPYHMLTQTIMLQVMQGITGW